MASSRSAQTPKLPDARWHLENSEIPSEEDSDPMEHNLDYSEDADEEESPPEAEDVDVVMLSSPDPLTGGDVQEAFYPLRAVADRVGQQVEQFAEALDRFNGLKRQSEPVNNKNVLDLVREYKRIAWDTVKQLEKHHGSELDGRTEIERKAPMQSPTRYMDISSASRGSGGLGLTPTVEDLQRWERETQTWDLFERLLEARYRPSSGECLNPDQGGSAAQNKLHRYSTEKDVWDHFLSKDEAAWERQTVLSWLMTCFNASVESRDAMKLSNKADTAAESGLWASGWLYSKEAIKAQKRLRSFSRPLARTSAGTDDMQLSSDRDEALVTQLDPDAVTRQSRTLEKQDQEFEDTTWSTCWEMIRRGDGWQTIREWCHERAELWRAVSLRDNLLTARQTPPPTGECKMSVQSGYLWRRMCYAAAKKAETSVYERAVYGVLSGDIETVEPACRSWNDFLFAYYNGLIIHQFDTYVHATCSSRLAGIKSDQFSTPNSALFHDEPSSIRRHLVDKLNSNDTIQNEARDPLKTVQGCLIADTFEEFLYMQGLAFSRCSKARGKSKIIPPVEGSSFKKGNTGYIAMDDYDSLRVITHMIAIYQDLGADFRHGPHRSEIEHIVVAYIDFLRLSGKIGTLPLYASRLSPERALLCLGRELNDVMVPQDRKMLVQLMEQLKIDVASFMNMQTRLVLSDIVGTGTITIQRNQAFEILEGVGAGRSTIRRVRRRFIGEDVNDDEQALIRGFEWYLLLDSRWPLTCAVGTLIYLHFLGNKRVAAARALAKSVSFSRLSLEKTPVMLGRKIDVSRSVDASVQDNDEGLNDQVQTSRLDRLRSEQRERRVLRSSSAAQNKIKRDLLNQKALTLRQLEQVVLALDALEQWADTADQMDLANQKSWKAQLQSRTDRVTEAIQPLLKGCLLYPSHDQENSYLMELRNTYLPEIVLAYVSVLHFGGHALSRDMLLDCMQFGATVARPGSDIAECFTAVGRMSELVDALAITSKAMLKANEQSSKANRSRKRSVQGGTLDIWTVRIS